MGQFFRILLIFGLLYLAVKLLTRLIFPPRNSQGPERGNNKEGDVTVENPSKGGKKISKDAGDYVDYEEVKD